MLSNLEKYYNTKFNNKFWKYIISSKTKHWDYELNQPETTYNLDTISSLTPPADAKNHYTHERNSIIVEINDNWSCINNNELLKCEDDLEYIDKYDRFDWNSLSCNPNITWEIIQNNPYMNWNWTNIFKNPNITWDIIKYNPNKFLWNENNILLNPNITWEVIQNNPNIKWFWTAISNNPNITWEIIQNNPNSPWDWSNISQNPNITWEIIQNNSDKPWNWSYLSCNPNITMEIIQNNPDKDWNWRYLSSNPNITREIMQNNPDKGWEWYNIFRNPNITLDIIQNYPDKDWNWDFISLNNYNIFQQIISNEKFEIIINNKNNIITILKNLINSKFCSSETIYNNFINTSQNLNPDLLLKYPDLFDNKLVSKNSMKISKKRYIYNNIKIKSCIILNKLFEDNNIIEYICDFL